MVNGANHPRVPRKHRQRMIVTAVTVHHIVASLTNPAKVVQDISRSGSRRQSSLRNAAKTKPFAVLSHISVTEPIKSHRDLGPRLLLPPG